MSKTIIRGKEITHDGRDKFWQKASDGLWEPETFDFIDSIPQGNSVFVDIGAWIGIFSLYAYSKKIRTVSVEPDPKAYSELIGNITLNEARISSYNVAVSDHNGKEIIKSMTTTGFGNSESSLVNRGVAGAVETVDSCTLESLLRPFLTYPLYLKIDTEGSEVLILRQSKEFLSRYKPTIFISFHPAWLPDLEQDTEMFIETLFPVYEVKSVGKGYKSYTEDEFRAAMKTSHDHSFLLKAK